MTQIVSRSNHIDKRRVTPIIKSEGQRVLLGVPDSTAEIARAINASGGLVSDWRNGRKAPGAEMKQRLRNAYNILPVAWSVRPGVPVQGVSPVIEPDPIVSKPMARAKEPSRASETAQVTLETAVVCSGTPSTLEDCLALLAVLRRDRGQQGLSPADRVRLTDAETRLLALRARLEAAEELAEDRYVYQHPAWQKLRRVIIGALERFPEAAQAVISAIKQHDRDDNS